jgi:hypothetical protein
MRLNVTKDIVQILENSNELSNFSLISNRYSVPSAQTPSLGRLPQLDGHGLPRYRQIGS